MSTKTSADLTRLIPAHAGKMPGLTTASSSPQAHPRSRGENTHGAPTAFSDPGSSPLTRGKFRRDRRARARVRLIPAHAGKIGPATRTRRRSRAHPRSRGENLNLGVERIEIRGSSPLTRGKFTARRGHRLERGLIPAHAGKIPAPAPPAPGLRAHPRSRGENIFG